MAQVKRVSRADITRAALWLLSAGFFLVLVEWTGLFARLDYWVLDTYQSRSEQQQSQTSGWADPVVVAIDEKTLKSVDEPLALSHKLIAGFLNAMVLAKPRAVGLDLVLPDKSYDGLSNTRYPQKTYHEILLDGLLSAVQSYPLVVAATWDSETGAFAQINLDYAAALSLDQSGQAMQASSLFATERDGVVRRYPGKEVFSSGHSLALSAALYQKAGGVVENPDGFIDYSLGPPFQFVSLLDVLGWLEQGNAELLQSRFQGRIVLLGTVLEGEDELFTPVPTSQWSGGSVNAPGVFVHAHVIRNLALDGLIKPIPDWLRWLLAGFGLLGFVGKSRLFKLSVVVTVVVSVALLCWLLLRMQWYWGPSAFLMALLLSVGVRLIHDNRANRLAKQRLRQAFGRAVSPQVLDRILSGQIKPSEQGVSCHLCVLAADIRGFTTLSERLPPDQVVKLLCRYFSTMTPIIHTHEGTVDKFIGDGLMAFFGAPNSLDCPESNAVAAAKAMIQALVPLNRELVALGYSPLEIGIGLHCGPAVVGHLGSEDRYEYTAVGDTVNVAFRLEGLCKELSTDLVVSAKVIERLRQEDWLQQFEPAGNRNIKGREALEVYIHRLPIGQKVTFQGAPSV